MSRDKKKEEKKKETETDIVYGGEKGLAQKNATMAWNVPDSSRILDRLAGLPCCSLSIYTFQSANSTLEWLLDSPSWKWQAKHCATLTLSPEEGTCPWCRCRRSRQCRARKAQASFGWRSVFPRAKPLPPAVRRIGVSTMGIGEGYR